MREIRKQVRDDVAAGRNNGHSIPKYEAKSSSPTQDSPSALLLSDELNYLNANWSTWYNERQISSHRQFLGPLIVKIKRYFVDQLFHSVLAGYFERERQFHMNLVRHLNSTARYIDRRTEETFLQLVKKIDADVSGVNERVDRLFDEANSTTRAVELGISEQLGKIVSEILTLQSELRTAGSNHRGLDDIVRGLERTLSILSKEGDPLTVREIANEPKPVSATTTGNPNVKVLDQGVDYLLLENRYRGSEELIKERLGDYTRFFDQEKKGTAPVLDLGCGRGEFLELLRDADIPAFGIDQDNAMVARCAEKGLRVIKADGIAYISQLPNRSLGGLFAAQVVEHLSKEVLSNLAELAAQKVKVGGKIIFETINPQSITALCRNFFRDPTHVWPLHPDTLRFICETKGLVVQDICYRSPYPDEAILQKVEMSEYLPSRFHSTLAALNDNVSRLNQLLFGYQDFAIVCTVTK